MNPIIEKSIYAILLFLWSIIIYDIISGNIIEELL